MLKASLERQQGPCVTRVHAAYAVHNSAE